MSNLLTAERRDRATPEQDRSGWLVLGVALLTFGGAAGCGDDSGTGGGGGGKGATSSGGGTTIPGCGTVTDVDGNEYETVIVGDQCWMRSNLRVASYDDGTPLPEEQGAGVWADFSNEVPAWCHYDNDPANDAEYGKLYNAFAISTNRLCPAGWRVPTNDQWNTLLSAVDNSGDALRAKVSWGLKEDEPTNASGFSALPAGRRDQFGQFENFATDTFPKAHFWSSTTESALQFWSVQLEPLAGVIRGTQRANAGLSLRCVQIESGGGVPTLETGIYDGTTLSVEPDVCPSFGVPPRIWEISYPDESTMTLTTQLVVSGGAISIGCTFNANGASCEPFAIVVDDDPNAVLTYAFEASEITYQSTASFLHTQPISVSCEGAGCVGGAFETLPCAQVYEIAYVKRP